ncbi:MAG: peptidylprolyl isomerase [Bacteroidetes bacterium HGW-Bacteroidetes-1]|jgi:FKBP-type peptidyl-prolyl cis-trans isomerase SlyD|nr:MAG: peptidylprolyl isomerase [Bacteroidetes bacterium HGW-Bacteroidetes-1]
MNDGAMKIEKNTIVTLYYKVQNARTGAMLQQLKEQPEDFLIGYDLLLDAFETGLLGLKASDTFSFEVKSEQAYGPVDPHAIFDMPLSTFEEEDGSIDEEVVQVGHVFPMEDKIGNKHLGKIIRKMKNRVTMDFNHPMAGKDLLFEGSIVGIRAAEDTELPHNYSCGCNNENKKREDKSIFEL